MIEKCTTRLAFTVCVVIGVDNLSLAARERKKHMLATQDSTLFCPRARLISLEQFVDVLTHFIVGLESGISIGILTNFEL
jgi:hypothetical protein